MEGLLGIRRVGGLLGSPFPTSGGSLGNVTVAGRGVAVVANNTNTTLSSAIIPAGSVVLPCPPCQREEGVPAYSAQMTNTNTPPGINLMAFTVSKDSANVDQFNLQIRHQNAGLLARTFDWAWLRLSP